jgi:iron complex outermembrane receptor protein
MCVAHCTIVPIAAAIAPSLAGVAGDELWHRAAVGFVVPVAAIAFFIGHRHHRDRRVIALGALGVALLAFAALAGHDLLSHMAERIATGVGGTLLAVTHLLNRRLVRSATSGCCSRPRGVNKIATCCLVAACALIGGCSARPEPATPKMPVEAPPDRAPDERPEGQNVSSPRDCTVSLDGDAVDADTHEPIPGATVAIGAQVVGSTDDDGHFHVEGLCPGELVIEVSRPDYEIGSRAITLVRSASIEIELQPGQGGEVIVIEAAAPRPVDMRSTAVISGEELEMTRGRAFADTLSEVPGVTTLRSGSGMAKPVVRGQFGRRLQILVDGVRHRSQDWGLDHAPEIDPFVADQITVVRGAAGVQYGPDAIGGAVLVDPPRLLTRPGLDAEAHAIGFADEGGSGAARVRSAPDAVPGLAWQVEGSFKRLAAPHTPTYPLDNTGSLEWSAGATVGYRPGDDSYTLSYRHYGARLGVCTCLRIESSEDFLDQIALERPIDADSYRADYEIERAFQSVHHDLAIARAQWELPEKGTVTGTYAFQYDMRREFDVVRTSTGPQFDFRLSTHDSSVVFEQNPKHLTEHLHLRGTFGAVGMFQLQDVGGLPLVPDYTAFSGGAFATERLIGHDFELEAGLRYDVTSRTAAIERGDFLRLVRSDQLEMDACGASDVDPVECSSTFHTVSASIGGLLQITQPLSVKLDLSTASRPPNPDEQFLNGTSPTFPVLGLGKPDLDAETTYSASVTTSYDGDRLVAEASGYGNFIADYIYFAPAIDDDGDPIFDVLVRGTFPRFVTRPVDAVFYGFDGGVAYLPHPSLELGGQLSMVRARNVSDDSYLVFVPSDRVRGSATYTHQELWGLSKASLSITGTYVARQNRFDLAADLAPPPDGYFLLDAEVGAEARISDQTVRFALQGTNLLDTRYRDYTSLLRYFADQPGWQLMLRLSVHYSNDD